MQAGRFDGGRARSWAVVSTLVSSIAFAQETAPSDVSAPEEPPPAAIQSIANAECVTDVALLLGFVSGQDELYAARARTTLDRCGAQLLPALMTIIDQTPPSERAPSRSVFRSIARHSHVAELRPFLARLPSDAQQQIERLRALEPRLPDLAEEAEPILDRLWRSDLTMPSRYLLLSPTATLARAGREPEVGRIETVIKTDLDGAVRARALDVGEPIAGIHAARIAASRDPEPRVRDAAIRTLRTEPGPDTEVAVLDRLASDPWIFVRVTAAWVLGTLPASAATDRGLADDLEKKPARVKTECITALANHKATQHIGQIRDRAKDDDESPDVRAAAIEALGMLCAHDDAGWLSELAQQNAPTDAPVIEGPLGLAATHALRMLKSPACRP